MHYYSAAFDEFQCPSFASANIRLELCRANLSHHPMCPSILTPMQTTHSHAFTSVLSLLWTTTPTGSWQHLQWCQTVDQSAPRLPPPCAHILCGGGSIGVYWLVWSTFPWPWIIFVPDLRKKIVFQHHINIYNKFSRLFL